MMSEHRIEWTPGHAVTAWEFAGDAPTIVLAHGAGTNRRHPMIVSLAGALSARGKRVVTFDYAYTEEGRRVPDRAPKLLAVHGAVTDWVRGRFPAPIVLAGRSMGGRMATMLAAGGVDAVGIVLYAYPLHPAGKPDRLRIDHLDHVGAPMLFFQGSRDPLSRSDLFDRHIRPRPNVTVVDMEGADHSFRGTGWTPDGVRDLLATETIGWIERLEA